MALDRQTLLRDGGDDSAASVKAAAEGSDDVGHQVPVVPEDLPQPCARKCQLVPISECHVDCI